MLALKPDKLNGQTILRPVTNIGGMQHVVNKSVFFPPSVNVKYSVVPVAEIVDMALRQIVSVSDQTSPEVQAMAQTFKKQLQKALHLHIARAAINERLKCTNELRASGLEMAAKAIDRPNYQPE